MVISVAEVGLKYVYLFYFPELRTQNLPEVLVFYEEHLEIGIGTALRREDAVEIIVAGQLLKKVDVSRALVEETFSFPLRPF